LTEKNKYARGSSRRDQKDRHPERRTRARPDRGTAGGEPDRFKKDALVDAHSLVAERKLTDGVIGLRITNLLLSWTWLQG